MAKRLKLGLVGCGGRGTGYFHYLRRLNVDFTVEALADVNDENLKAANSTFAGNKAKLFKSGEELIAKSQIDAVIIATPNKFHREPAIAAMGRKVPMLLEKPIASCIEDLAAIWQAYSKNHAGVVVGFSLRFSPFYRAIKEVLQKGSLGQLLTIHAEELMSDRLSMLFSRSQWRPEAELSGGLLLEKCCHDIDVLNWLTASKALKINSFANRSFLLPGKREKCTCDICPEDESCRFSKTRIIRSFQKNMTETQTDRKFDLSHLINNECPYHIGTPVFDHQSVIIEYQNGVICTFNVVQVQPANRRTIHILGSEARLYGNIDDNYFTVYHRTGPNNEEPEIIRVHPDSSGHNGSDGPLTTDFLQLIEGKPNPQRPGLKEGIESAIMCLVADQSVGNSGSIELDPIRNEIFGVKHDSHCIHADMPDLKVAIN